MYSPSDEPTAVLRLLGDFSSRFQSVSTSNKSGYVRPIINANKIFLKWQPCHFPVTRMGEPRKKLCDHIVTSPKVVDNLHIQWGLEFQTRSEFGWSMAFGFQMVGHFE